MRTALRAAIACAMLLPWSQVGATTHGAGAAFGTGYVNPPFGYAMGRYYHFDFNVVGAYVVGLPSRPQANEIFSCSFDGQSSTPETQSAGSGTGTVACYGSFVLECSEVWYTRRRSLTTAQDNLFTLYTPGNWGCTASGPEGYEYRIQLSSQYELTNQTLYDDFGTFFLDGYFYLIKS